MWNSQPHRHRAEKLGESDKGVIMFRRQLMQQLELVMASRSPLCVFRDRRLASVHHVPIEHVRPRDSRYQPTEAGFSRDAEDRGRQWRVVGAVPLTSGVKWVLVSLPERFMT